MDSPYDRFIVVNNILVSVIAFRTIVDTANNKVPIITRISTNRRPFWHGWGKGWVGGNNR